MNEIYAIKKDTPHVRANKINERIARYPGMPQIYHKEFDLHEFIGEEIAGIRGVNSVHYFPILFEDIDTLLDLDQNYQDGIYLIDINWSLVSELANQNNRKVVI